MNLDTLMSADDIKREGRDKDEEINEAVNSILLGKLSSLILPEIWRDKTINDNLIYIPINHQQNLSLLKWMVSK